MTCTVLNICAGSYWVFFICVYCLWYFDIAGIYEPAVIMFITDKIHVWGELLRILVYSNTFHYSIGLLKVYVIHDFISLQLSVYQIIIIRLYQIYQSKSINSYAPIQFLVVLLISQENKGSLEENGAVRLVDSGVAMTISVADCADNECFSCICSAHVKYASYFVNGHWRKPNRLVDCKVRRHGIKINEHCNILFYVYIENPVWLWCCHWWRRIKQKDIDSTTFVLELLALCYVHYIMSHSFKMS